MILHNKTIQPSLHAVHNHMIYLLGKGYSPEYVKARGCNGLLASLKDKHVKTTIEEVQLVIELMLPKKVKEQPKIVPNKRPEIWGTILTLAGKLRRNPRLMRKFGPMLDRTFLRLYDNMEWAKEDIRKCQHNHSLEVHTIKVDLHCYPSTT